MSAAAAAAVWSGSTFGHAVMRSEEGRCRNAPRGARHKTLFSCACRIGELVAGGEIDIEYARAFLLSVGRGLKPDDIGSIERAIKAGLAKGSRTPRRAGGAAPFIQTASDARIAVWGFANAALSVQTCWASRTGGTDQRVLLALCMMSLNAGKSRLGVSVRQVAEYAGVGVATAHRSLGRLEGRWVRRTHVGDRRASKDRSTYQLLLRQSYTDLMLGCAELEQEPEALRAGKGRQCSVDARSEWKPATMPLGNLTGGLGAPGFAVWRRRSNAWRLWVALRASDERVTASMLAKALGMRLRTVYSNLLWLADAGMADQDLGRWWALSPAEEEVAADLELPSPELRRQRHRIDRAEHKIRLEANRAFGALRAGGITPEEHRIRMQGIVHRAQQLYAERAQLQRDWQTAYEHSRANELARRGRSCQ